MQHRSRVSRVQTPGGKVAGVLICVSATAGGAQDSVGVAAIGSGRWPGAFITVGSACRTSITYKIGDGGVVWIGSEVETQGETPRGSLLE